MWCILLVQFVCNALDLLDVSRNTEPGVGLRSGSVVLSVKSEVCVVLALDEPIIPLVAIAAPWLY